MTSESHSPPRVLIVDDDPDVLDVLEETLQRAWVEVVRTNSSHEALEHLERSEFQLLLTDIDMDEMNGIQLIRAAKLIAPALPVIVITGTQRARFLGDLGDLDVEAWFSKPFDPLAILEHVRATLALQLD